LPNFLLNLFIFDLRKWIVSLSCLLNFPSIEWFVKLVIAAANLSQRCFANLSVLSSLIIPKTELNTLAGLEAVVSVCCRAPKVFWVLIREFFDLAIACGASANPLTRLYAALQLCYARVATAITLAVALRGSILVARKAERVLVYSVGWWQTPSELK
jgi:hypothetical protein